jgi:hypothetical protein
MSTTNKKTGKKATGSNMAGAREPQKHGATAGGSAATRGGGAAVKSGTKESFVKKLLICQKIYDYKDESKDVKGKTERLNAINEIQQLL